MRTITMGISLLDCCDSDIDVVCEKVYEKITRCAKDLVKTGEEIEKELGIPIVNKRISITPAAIILAGCKDKNAVKLALTLERAAVACGVNCLGGFSALVQKGFSAGDRELIEAIPEALAVTEHICASVNVGSTKAGINMDAVALMGRIVREAAERTADCGCIGPAKLVVLCNAPEDNPFMAGAPAWFVPRWRRRAPIRIWVRLRILSRKPLLRLPVWVSWWRRKPLSGWASPLVSSIYP